MGSIGPAEVLVVLVAALIFLGPQRLPEAARQLGKALAEFRRVSSDLQAEVRDAFAEQPVPPAPPTQEAALPPAVHETATPPTGHETAVPPEEHRSDPTE